MSQEAVADLLDADDPVGSLARIVRTYEEASTSPQRRVRYFFQEPSVRLGRVRGARPGRSADRAAAGHRRDDRRCRPAWLRTPWCSATSPRWSSGTWTAAPRRSRSTSRTACARSAGSGVQENRATRSRLETLPIGESGNASSTSRRSGSLNAAISWLAQERDQLGQRRRGARPAARRRRTSARRARRRAPGRRRRSARAGWPRMRFSISSARDLLAAAVDQVLLAARDDVVAGRVPPHEVAGAVEAVGGERARVVLRRPEVAAQRVRARGSSSSPTSPSATSSPFSSTRRTSSSGQIGRPTVSSRTSCGSSRRTNISRPSAMPKFSCTVHVRQQLLGQEPGLGLQPLAAALDDPHARTGRSASIVGVVEPADQQRGHDVDVGDPVLLDQREHLRAAGGRVQHHPRAREQEALHAGAGQRAGCARSAARRAARRRRDVAHRQRQSWS